MLGFQYRRSLATMGPPLFMSSSTDLTSLGVRRSRRAFTCIYDSITWLTIQRVTEGYTIK